MRGKGPLSRESFVRDLPFSVVKRLALDLDLSALWESFVEQVPKSLSNSEENFEPRYTAQHVGLFSRQLQLPNGSPTRAILQDWSTQNCTIQHLLSALYRANLTAAGNFIKHEVLHEPDESQSEEGPIEQLPIPSTFLPPIRIDAVPGDHLNKVQVPDQQNTGCLSDPSTDFMQHRRCQAVQNDLSSMKSDTSSSYLVKKHDKKFYCGAEGEVFAPNMSSKLEEKLQGMAAGKKIDPINFQGNSCQSPLPLKIEPVIKNTGNLQLLSYRELEDITDGFNEKPHNSGGRMIGKGGFGMVHLGIDRDKKWVAVKVLKEDTDVLRKQFRTEVDTLSKLKHENLLTLLGYSLDGPKCCIVYEYMANGSLEDRLACVNGSRPLPAEVRVNICKGTARAIVFLNSQGYIHRDIKSANILLDKDLVPKLGDFATTRIGPSGDGMTQSGTSVVIGTSAYLAPEAYNFDVSAKLDSYSFGVVVLELLTGLPAFNASREDKDLRSHMSENCSDIMEMLDRYGGDWVESNVKTMYDVAVRCLETRKKKRANVKDVLGAIEML